MKSLKMVVFGLLGIVAIGAMAALAHAEWNVEDRTLTELKLSEEKLTISGGPVTLAGPKLGFTLECGKASGSGSIFKGGSDEYAISLTTCKVVGSAACKVVEPVTLKVKSELVHGNGYYEKIVPAKEGAPLATVSIEGKECALAKENKITGSVAAEILPEEGTTRKLKTSEKFSKTIAEEGGKYELLVGTALAYMTAEFSMELSGSHAGGEWFNALNTKLCDRSAVMDQCPAGKLWLEGSVIYLKGEGTMKFEVGIGKFECTGTVMEGTTHFDEGDPLFGVLENVVFSGCSGGCEMKAIGLPFQVSFEDRAVGGGRFILYLAGLPGTPSFEAKCGTKVCKYGQTAGIHFTRFDGSSPAKLLAGPIFFKEEEGTEIGCATTGKWYGPTGGGVTLIAESPSPLFVTG
jgi:hypothetical protein